MAVGKTVAPVDAIRERVDYAMGRAGGKNIAICMHISDEEIKGLRRFYNVQRQPFGYIQFARKEEGLV